MINDNADDDRIDLKPILKTLWRSWRFTVCGTFFFTLVGAIYVACLPKTYLSQGFYQAKMTQAAYKATANVLTDKGRVFRFLAQKNAFDDASLRSLSNSIADSGEFAKSFAPSFEKDLIGISVNWGSDSPAMSQKMVVLLAEFFRDALLYNSIHDYISAGYLEASDSLNTVKSLILENAFQQRQMASRKSDLQLIRKEYPTATVEIKQVFSAKGADSYEYLSPGTEIIKAEVAIGDLKRERTKLERDLEIAQMKYDLFSRENEVLRDCPPSGELLFKQFIESRNKFFKDKDLSKDTVQEFEATLPQKLETLNKALLSMYFISGPTYPGRRLPRGGMRILAGVFCVSFLLFNLLALVLDWWHHTKAILGEELPLPGHNHKPQMDPAMTP